MLINHAVKIVNNDYVILTIVHTVDALCYTIWKFTLSKSNTI